MQRLTDASLEASSTESPILHAGVPPSHDADPSRRPAADALEFGRFRLLLRQRQLLADGVEVKLGTRAFNLLLALLEADGSLVTKDELVNRAWPGINVAEENLKVQILALRSALGEDRDFIRTEFGRGYRFVAAIRRTVAPGADRSPHRWRYCRAERPVARWTCRQPLHAGAFRN